MMMSKTSWICLGILVLLVGALVALDAYCLEMTQGCYNALDILFL